MEKALPSVLYFFVAAFFAATCSAQNPGISNSINSAIVGNRTSSAISSGVSDSIATRTIKLKLEIDKTKGEISAFILQPDRIAIQSFSNRKAIVWDFTRSTEIAEVSLPANSRPIYFDLKTWRLFFFKDGDISSISLDQATPPSPVLVSNGPYSDVAFHSSGGQFLAVKPDGTVRNINNNSNTVWEKRFSIQNPVQIISNHDGTLIAVKGKDGSAILANGKGEVLTQLSNAMALGRFNPDGQFPVSFENGDIAVLGPGGKRKEFPRGKPSSDADLSIDGKAVLAVSPTGTLEILTNDNWNSTGITAKFARFIDGKRYLSVGGDGVIHLREIGLPHYLAAIIPGHSGWIIVDHEGRYDGTTDGLKDVTWSGDGTKVELEQFFNTYFQPGLLGAYLSQNTRLEAVPAKPQDGIFPPAKLDLEFPDGKLEPGKANRIVAVAESLGGQLDAEIRLFHNGKRLPEKARIGSQLVKRDNKIILVQVFSLVPEAGINEIFGEILNEHGLSTRSNVKRETTEGYRSPGSLFILGAGIDKYRLTSINLDFATIDVTAITDRLKGGSSLVYNQTIPTLVVDSKATKELLLAQLRSLEASGPEDSIVLILAGHGQAIDGEWYFLPHDVDTKQIKRTAVSARAIQDALVAAPAKRILLIVDSCYSGATIDTFYRFGSFQKRFAQQLGRNAGVTVVTATRRDQEAAELPRLGHGVFTQVILDGLSGKAAESDRGGAISAHQLANFVGTNFPRFAQSYLGGTSINQTPAHFVIGSDFLLTKKPPN